MGSFSSVVSNSIAFLIAVSEVALITPNQRRGALAAYGREGGGRGGGRKGEGREGEWAVGEEKGEGEGKGEGETAAGFRWVSFEEGLPFFDLLETL